MPSSHGRPDPDCDACLDASFVAKRPTPCAEHDAVPTLAWLRDSVPQPLEPPDKAAALERSSEAVRLRAVAQCRTCRGLRADDPAATCPEHEHRSDRTWFAYSDDALSNELFNALLMSI